MSQWPLGTPSIRGDGSCTCHRLWRSVTSRLCPYAKARPQPLDRDEQAGTELKYLIDLAKPDEMPLCYQSWSRTFRAEPASQRMPDRAFYLWHRDLVDRLLASGAQVFVARDVERPVFLFGWLCAQRVGQSLVPHYAYVKRPWRERGIGTALLVAAMERLGEGATELLQSHGSRQYDHRLAAMGFRKVAVEKLLRAGKVAA